MQQRMKVCISADAVYKTSSVREEAKALLRLTANDLPVTKAIYACFDLRFSSTNKRETNGKTLGKRIRAV